MTKVFSINSKVVRYACYAIICIFSAFAIYSFITTPFTGDIHVFMAAANQVRYQKVDGLLAVFESWETRGIGNRLLMYTIYRLANATVGYENSIAFETVSKAFYALLITIIIALSTRFISNDRKAQIKIFFTTMISFFATFTAVQMQAEMTCVAIGIFVAACVIYNKKWSLILAGVAGALLLFFKSIFVLMFFVALFAAALYDAKKEIKIKSYLTSVVSFFITEFFLVWAVKIIYPQEFKDMLAVSEFQETLFSLGSNVNPVSMLYRFTGYFIQSSIAIPVIFLGLICAIILIVHWAHERQGVQIALLIFCWIIPVDMILVSNKYFIYHYFCLVLPSIISVIMLMREIKFSRLSVVVASSIILAICGTFAWNFLKTKNVDLVTFSTVVLVELHLLALAVIIIAVPRLKKFVPLYGGLLLTVCMLYWTTYSSAISLKYENFRALNEVAVQISELAFPDDWSSEPVFLLDDGSSTFYKSAPSFTRYFFNLPMQRWTKGNDWYLQKQEYEKFKNYNGKYILYSSWFGLEKYPELIEKINNEYKRLPGSGMYYHSPSWNFFELLEIPDVQETLKNTDICILVRKDAK